MSSYNTRYSARYKDLEIEIKKLDYTGSSSTITHLAPQPLELSYTGDKGERKYVQGSSLTFSFYELNGEDYDEIFDSDYRDYKLLLRNYDSSTVVWEGYIKPENLTKSYLDYHKLINLQATDAIADLKDIPFEKVGGRVPILNVVKNALSYTGIELPIEIQLNTWETSHMTEGECPIEKAYIDTRKFYALKDGKTEYDDSYTVLERVLQPFSSTIKQSNGAYRITNYNEIESNVFVYDFSTLSFIEDISSNSLINLDNYKFHTSSDKTKIRPLRYVDLTFANKDMGGELISNISNWVDPSIWTIGGEWTVESNTTLFIMNDVPGFDCSLALTTPFAVNYINGNEYMSLSLDMKIDPIPGNPPATSGDAIYLQVWLKEAAGSWTEAANWYVSRTVFYENYASTASPAWKIPGDTTYQMYLVITAPDDFNGMYIRIKNLSLTQVNYLDGEISDAVVFDKNFIGDIGINKDRLTDKIYFGDSDAITEISAITIGTLNLSSKWCLWGEDTSARIQELYTRNILRNNRKFRDYISLEVIDPSDHILPASLIQIGSKVYTITDYYKNFSESPADNYVRLSIDELLTDDPSIFYFSQTTLTSIDGESTAPTNNVVPSTGDHGALTGLGDDDHPQYLNNARGDARYPSVSYIDGSLVILKSYVDTEISYIEASINNTYDAGMWFVPEASFNDSYFKWVSGYLEPSIAGGGTGDVTKLYVDGSLAVRDARIAAINASLGDEDNILSYVNSSTYYDGSLNLRLLKSGDTMTGTLVVDTCIGIGKTPSYKLDVNGDINMPASSYFRLNTNPAIQQNGGYMTFGWLSSVYHFFRTSTSSPYLALIKGNAVALGIDGNSNTDLYNHRVVNLATPTDASDATNRYYVDASLNGKANKNTFVIPKTSAYTLTSTDNNCVIEASGTFGIYLPTNLDVGFQALIMNVGGGTITINASTGATVYTRDSSNDLTKRWTGATVYKRDSASWAAMGDLN